MKWISAADWNSFNTDGFMVIKNVVPDNLIKPACEEIAAFISADIDDKSTWYNGDLQNDGLVPVHHLQSIWDIRQNSNVYAAFSEFWGGEQKLFVDINRSCFRPPIKEAYPSLSKGEIHWDIDPRNGSKGWIQGIVLLTDISKNTGGFQCIPEVYKNISSWLARNGQDKDFNHFYPGLNEHPEIIQIEGKAGDIILWSTLLPHGPALNSSALPRIASFMTLTPNEDYNELANETRELILQKRAPEKWRGLPQQLDPEPGSSVVLSELGKKLTGFDSW